MRGFLYPLRFKTDGNPVETEDDNELVASAVTQFLSQLAGERPYDDLNGHNLDNMLFENESELVKANARREIALGLAAYEPRIRVVEVVVRYVDQGVGLRTEITVNYVYRNQLFSTTRDFLAKVK